MPKPVLIIVTGQPATGKTLIAKRLAGDLRLPFFGRDYSIKEKLFEELGLAADREKSKLLGRASYRVLFQVLDGAMTGQQSIMVESNFSAQSAEPIKQLAATHGYVTVLITLTTDDEIRQQRFIDRVRTGERHPGHHDTSTGGVAESEAENPPLVLLGAGWQVDTTSFDDHEYAELRDRLQHFLTDPSAGTN